MLAALGRTNALKLNYRMALRNGAELPEIFEAIFQVAAYAGFAAAWDVLEMLAEVLDEDGFSTVCTSPGKVDTWLIRWLGHLELVWA